MKAICLILLFTTGLGGALAQDPPRTSVFQVGVYGDDARTVTCVSGSAGATFEQVVWAWVPDNLGLSYITLRFAFPPNLDQSRDPVFNDLVFQVIYTDYVNDTVEWNMLFNGCPSGWVWIFTQECELLDGQLSLIEIQAAHSMIRDCTFVLNDVEVLNQLVLNDPACATVPAATTAWGAVKSLYRR